MSESIFLYDRSVWHTAFATSVIRHTPIHDGAAPGPMADGQHRVFSRDDSRNVTDDNAHGWYPARLLPCVEAVAALVTRDVRRGRSCRLLRHPDLAGALHPAATRRAVQRRLRLLRALYPALRHHAPAVGLQHLGAELVAERHRESADGHRLGGHGGITRAPAAASDCLAESDAAQRGQHEARDRECTATRRGARAPGGAGGVGAST